MTRDIFVTTGEMLLAYIVAREITKHPTVSKMALIPTKGIMRP
jgi:hypothetical protein